MFSINSHSSLDLTFTLDPDQDFGFELGPTTSLDPIELVKETHSGSGSGQPLSIAEQRKLRRKISNRQSARRSRARKQQHIEGIHVNLARLKAENQNLANRLRAIVNKSKLVQYQNCQLTTESVMLRHRLAEIRRVLVLRQQLQRLGTSPYNGFGPGSGHGYGLGLEQALASLIS